MAHCIVIVWLSSFLYYITWWYQTKYMLFANVQNAVSWGLLCINKSCMYIFLSIFISLTFNLTLSSKITQTLFTLIYTVYTNFCIVCIVFGSITIDLYHFLKFKLNNTWIWYTNYIISSDWIVDMLFTNMHISVWLRLLTYCNRIMYK